MVLFFGIVWVLSFIGWHFGSYPLLRWGVIIFTLSMMIWNIILASIVKNLVKIIREFNEELAKLKKEQ